MAANNVLPATLAGGKRTDDFGRVVMARDSLEDIDETSIRQ